mmetsp:Transcript_52696/g.162212  ORF Transcript_52696/g.162212 Transcript_52696/m.162212 type:complete len:213 (+) Transcript_52696:237-875(+)
MSSDAHLSFGRAAASARARFATSSMLTAATISLRISSSGRFGVPHALAEYGLPVIGSTTIGSMSICRIAACRMAALLDLASRQCRRRGSASAAPAASLLSMGSPPNGWQNNQNHLLFAANSFAHLRSRIHRKHTGERSSSLSTSSAWTFKSEASPQRIRLPLRGCDPVPIRPTKTSRRPYRAGPPTLGAPHWCGGSVGSSDGSCRLPRVVRP